MSTFGTSLSSTPLDILARPKSAAQIRSGIGARDGVSAEAKYEEARTAAEGLVATSFIKPILAQVRESNNTPPPFGPTQAEKQFGSLLDNQLADEIARASQFPIVDRLVEEFTKHLPNANTKTPSRGMDLKA